LAATVLAFRLRPSALFLRNLMKTTLPKLSALGTAFLKPGDNAIHFYYSEAEQLRFSSFLQSGFNDGQGIIVAGVGGRHPLLSQAVKTPRLHRKRNFLRLQVTANLHATISTVADAATALLQRTRELRIAVDFDGLVSTEAIFENEAKLSEAFRGKRAIVISQYDGNAFPAPVTMEQFKTHAVTVIGNAFYLENRNRVAPEEYLLIRQRKAHVAAAAAAAARVSA
jgi:hypothetical protein